MNRFLCRHFFGWPCTVSYLTRTRTVLLTVLRAVGQMIVFALAFVVGCGLAALIAFLAFAL